MTVWIGRHLPPTIQYRNDCDHRQCGHQPRESCHACYVSCGASCSVHPACPIPDHHRSGLSVCRLVPAVRPSSLLDQQSDESSGDVMMNIRPIAASPLPRNNYPVRLLVIIMVIITDHSLHRVTPSAFHHHRVQSSCELDGAVFFQPITFTCQRLLPLILGFSTTPLFSPSAKAITGWCRHDLLPPLQPFPSL